jgi:hypothetical protein
LSDLQRLTHSKSVCCDFGCIRHRGSLEVVNEGPLEVLPGVDGVWFKAFEPSEGCRFQGYWDVECLGGVGSAIYLLVIRIAKGSHADLMIRRALSLVAVLD